MTRRPALALLTLLALIAGLVGASVRDWLRERMRYVEDI